MGKRNTKDMVVIEHWQSSRGLKRYSLDPPIKVAGLVMITFTTTCGGWIYHSYQYYQTNSRRRRRQPSLRLNAIQRSPASTTHCKKNLFLSTTDPWTIRGAMTLTQNKAQRTRDPPPILLLSAGMRQTSHHRPLHTIPLQPLNLSQHYAGHAIESAL